MGRQGRANVTFGMLYQYIFAFGVGILTLRHIIQTVALMRLHKHSHRAVVEEQDGTVGKKLRPDGDLDRYLFHPVATPTILGRSWTPTKIALALFVFVLNVAFSLPVAIHTRGHQMAYNNNAHAFAVRCGFMALAQAPAIFALTGRNSIVQFLTGIKYQELRFLHKVRHWSGLAGIKNLLTKTLGISGLVAMGGLIVIVCGSLRVVRRRFYETFLVSHNQPELRAWLYVAIGFWAFERIARISSTFIRSWRLHPVVIEAEAQLIHDAIVLRVPFHSTWRAGEHAYLSILDSNFVRWPHLFAQTHPFSIANIPSSADRTQLFVIRVHDGITKTIARHLEVRPQRTGLIRLSVEGPHCLSHLDDIVAQSRQPASRSTTVTLVWTIQQLVHTQWVLQELLLAVEVARAAGVNVVIRLYVTQGGLQRRSESVTTLQGSTEKLPASEGSPKRRSFVSITTETDVNDLFASPEITTVHDGRPDVGRTVKEFATEGAGGTLIIGTFPV
ncbi:hypothetical protein RQP46_010478 [Phenoliferia psychrophenolica]